MSYSVNVGKSIMAPGKFMFFLSPKTKSFITFTVTLSSDVEMTLHVRFPSAMYMVEPAPIVVGNDLYEQVIASFVPR